MWSYNYNNGNNDWLEHQMMLREGEYIAHADHKYISKKMINGQWRYFYDDVSDSAKTGVKTAKAFRTSPNRQNYPRMPIKDMPKALYGLATMTAPTNNDPKLKRSQKPNELQKKSGFKDGAENVKYTAKELAKFGKDVKTVVERSKVPNKSSKPVRTGALGDITGKHYYIPKVKVVDTNPNATGALGDLMRKTKAADNNPNANYSFRELARKSRELGTNSKVKVVDKKKKKKK